MKNDHVSPYKLIKLGKEITCPRGGNSTTNKCSAAIQCTEWSLSSTSALYSWNFKRLTLHFGIIHSPVYIWGKCNSQLPILKAIHYNNIIAIHLISWRDIFIRVLSEFNSWVMHHVDRGSIGGKMAENKNAHSWKEHIQTKHVPCTTGITF